MPEEKIRYMPNGVLAICPECMFPARYDFDKEKWICDVMTDGCKHVFDWIDESGVKQIWRKPE